MKIVFYSFLIFATFGCAGGGDDLSDYDDGVAVNSEFHEGKVIYDRTCVVCHMKDGKGLEGTFPPLVGSDYLLDNPARALEQVLNGSSGEMTVNGVVYDGIMPAQEVSKEEAVEVVNYILNAWGNDGGKVTIEDIDSE